MSAAVPLLLVYLHDVHMDFTITFVRYILVQAQNGKLELVGCVAVQCCEVRTVHTGFERVSIFLQWIQQHCFEMHNVNLFTPFLMCTVGCCTVLLLLLLLSLLYSFHVCIGLAGCFKNTTVLQIHEVGYTVLVVHARIFNTSNFQFDFMLISVFLLKKKRWRYSQSKIDKISAHLLLPIIKGGGANIAGQCIPPHKKALLFIHITAQIAKCLTEKEPEGLSGSRDC